MSNVENKYQFSRVIKRETYYSNGEIIEHVFWSDGTEHYSKNGYIHRDDGPAIIRSDGSKFWMKNDNLHRLDGPAREYANGHKYWFIDDKEYSEEEYNRRIKLLFFI